MREVFTRSHFHTGRDVELCKGQHFGPKRAALERAIDVTARQALSSTVCYPQFFEALCQGCHLAVGTADSHAKAMRFTLLEALLDVENAKEREDNGDEHWSHEAGSQSDQASSLIRRMMELLFGSKKINISADAGITKYINRSERPGSECYILNNLSSAEIVRTRTFWIVYYTDALHPALIDGLNRLPELADIHDAVLMVPHDEALRIRDASNPDLLLMPLSPRTLHVIENL
ncbi:MULTISPECIES: hypothetical protein [Phyllobacterium]|jgi:hypothetical protein|uniref:hypothetical protein n=1 Tax=Phyllobacterium TaxID=28100 RepID=UPI001CBA71A5|nr:hypothetical protein [Phyllobacterium calauticae]MBZ3695463.1 hypothetical protein [Phyllobacterium calauticae]